MDRTDEDSDRTLTDEELVNQLRRPHLVIEDCWYSCPKSGECCNDAAGDTCWCGADEHNALLDRLIAALRAERHEHVLTDLECDLREAADRIVGLASEMSSPDTVDCLHAKAEGVRLALSYLHNAARSGPVSTP